MPLPVERVPEEPSAYSNLATKQAVGASLEESTMLQARESAVQELSEEADGIEFETKAPLEVDLTCDVDALEDHTSVEAVAQPVDVVSALDEEVVYELSASPALHDLASALAAAALPPVVAEPLPVIESASTPPVVAHEEAGTRKPGNPRKQSDKREPANAAKPSAARPLPDEWGLFDPNRCGFAALVDKLNRVTDEEDPKGTRTTVRVISHR
jgi:hypothetical protein